MPIIGKFKKKKTFFGLPIFEKEREITWLPRNGRKNHLVKKNGKSGARLERPNFVTWTAVEPLYTTNKLEKLLAVGYQQQQKEKKNIWDMAHAKPSEKKNRIDLADRK